MIHIQSSKRPLSRAFALLLALGSGCGQSSPESAVESQATKPRGDLFPGTAVELPPPLKGLKFGAPQSQAETILPGITNGSVELKSYEGRTTVYVFSSNPRRTLLGAQLTVPTRADEMRTILAEKWGPPRETNTQDGTVYTWFNPREGLRARLVERTSSVLRSQQFVWFTQPGWG